MMQCVCIGFFVWGLVLNHICVVICVWYIKISRLIEKELLNM